MSDTGEQGMTPQDPADQAGIGGGIIPDDQGEGDELATELAARQKGEEEDAGERDD
ncbi:MAG TPA: hypothetical protein VHZ96_08130 [Frankiaceae bacterium]|jgi:hypothetical protein|nr:hypothetical protein [Frankiaceae bacterium]